MGGSLLGGSPATACAAPGNPLWLFEVGGAEVPERAVEPVVLPDDLAAILRNGTCS